MNYELAKQLKEAGFTQETEFYFVRTPTAEHVVLWHRDRLSTPTGETASWEQIAAPTLSELIAAIRGETIMIYRREKTGAWTASSSDGYDDSSDKEGATPEEAVARLWLALNPTSPKEEQV